jgi:hypothetical protein
MSFTSNWESWIGERIFFLSAQITTADHVVRNAPYLKPTPTVIIRLFKLNLQWVADNLCTRCGGEGQICCGGEDKKPTCAGTNMACTDGMFSVCHRCRSAPSRPGKAMWLRIAASQTIGKSTRLHHREGITE